MQPALRIRTALIVALVLLLALPVVASAGHAWANYHWARTSNPFTLSLGDNVSGTWDSSLVLASSDWSQSSVLDTSIVAGGTNPKRCRPNAGRVEVCNSKYGRNGWLGLAQIWVSGSHITQGVAKMNDTYFSTATYNSQVWRNHVMCQEVGHTFGLGHQDESGASLGTCMDYSSDPTNSQHPNAHDYDQLEAIYAHLDSSTTIGAMPPGMAAGGFDSPQQWGQLVSSSRDGHHSVYLRDFGGGHGLVTFVTWAD